MRAAICCLALVATVLGAAATAADAPDGWMLRSPAPGAPACRAAKRGPQVDIQLLRNRDGQLVLIAGHPDWQLRSDPNGAPVRLTVDDAPAVSLTGYALGPVLLVPIADSGLAARIEAARTLKWTLPSGEFTADVTCLGTAFAAIGVCPDRPAG